MSIGLLFWILMILWLVFGFFLGWRGTDGTWNRNAIGGGLLIFVLLFLLGWAQFGFVIHQ